MSEPLRDRKVAVKTCAGCGCRFRVGKPGPLLHRPLPQLLPPRPRRGPAQGKAVMPERTADPDAPVKGRGRCPVCACRKTARLDQPVTEFYARTLEVCANCKAVWEPLPPGGDHLDDDGTPFPFPDPCDNCAFRPGSPEQQDTEGWKKLMAQLKAGATFHCHKGVPIVPGSEHGFAYPGGGKPHPQLRLCRGFLQMWGTRMKKGVARLQEEEVEL